jgi:hypothetical protein
MKPLRYRSKRSMRRLTMKASVWLLVLSLPTSATLAFGASPGMPRPFSPGKVPTPEAAQRTNDECIKCHQDVATEWRASLHAQAYTNPEFQRALHVEPVPFCRGCHAPDADPDRADKAALQSQGVSCVSCHVVSDGILGVAKPAKPAKPANPARGKTHPVLASPDFKTSAACANCHQFAFPGESSRVPTNLMQSTVDEFLQRSGASQGCAGCHMPVDEAGHRSHRFDVTRNAALLQSALWVSARRTAAHQVEIQLTPRGVGHAFPTGDLFRRLSVEVEAIGPEYSRLEAHTVYLTREFETTHTAGGVKRRRPIRDTRLLADGSPRTVVVQWESDVSPYPVRFRVLYQRVQHPGKVGQPDAEIAGEVLLAEGELAVQKGTP